MWDCLALPRIRAARDRGRCIPGRNHGYPGVAGMEIDSGIEWFAVEGIAPTIWVAARGAMQVAPSATNPKSPNPGHF
jgi:hypothetical protein